MKFVQYIYIHDKIHSKVRTKKPTKYVVNFLHISEVSDIQLYIYTTKYTLSWNKKAYKIYRKFPIHIGNSVAALRMVTPGAESHGVTFHNV